MSQDKLDKPAFAGERESDRAARAALQVPRVKCSDNCSYGKHANSWEHSPDCPRYVKPSDELPF